MVAFDRPQHKDSSDGPDAPRGPEPLGQGAADAPARVPAPDLPDRAAYWAEYKKAVDAEYRAYAIDQGCDRVREIEKSVVTPAMERIEAEDPDRHLVGLEFRLKGRDRLTEKVSSWMDAEPNLTAGQAFSMVKDSIRYTFQYANDHYSDGVRLDCERLKAEGFDFIELRNSWDSEDYKGINSRWRVAGSDQLFEVQFHTKESFQAKQVTHSAYEVLRNPHASEAEQEEAALFQRQVTSRVSVPPGANGIQAYV